MSMSIKPFPSAAYRMTKCNLRRALSISLMRVHVFGLNLASESEQSPCCCLSCRDYGRPVGQNSVFLWLPMIMDAQRGQPWNSQSQRGIDEVLAWRAETLITVFASQKLPHKLLLFLRDRVWTAEYWCNLLEAGGGCFDIQRRDEIISLSGSDTLA